MTDKTVVICGDRVPFSQGIHARAGLLALGKRANDDLLRCVNFLAPRFLPSWPIWKPCQAVMPPSRTNDASSVPIHISAQHKSAIKRTQQGAQFQSITSKSGIPTELPARREAITGSGSSPPTNPSWQHKCQPLHKAVVTHRQPILR